MSQMPQLSTCPSCEEPLESGDRFCGACGYDLSAVPAPPGDHPTVPLAGAGTPPAERAEPVTPPAGAAPPAPPSGAGQTAPGAGPMVPPPPPPPPPPPVAPPAGADASVPPPPPPPPAAPPAPATPSAAPEPASGGGVRFDRPSDAVGFGGPAAFATDGADTPPPGPDEYALQAPDPRIAADPAARAPSQAQPPAPAAKVCVACRAGRVDSDGYCENCGHAQPRERDHMEQDAGAVAAVSDRGLRHHRNEDAFAITRAVLPDGSPATVAIVCDGVSSATRPDDASLAASRAASEALLTALPRGTHPQQAMHEAIVAASHAVNSLAAEPATALEQGPHQNAPACTLVGAVVTPGLLVVGWVGDSRAYWVPVDRGTPPARLTEDDSWAAQMVAAGLMNEAEAYADERAHAITGWLGADAYELEPHTASFKPDRPGVVVVCTDGLWNYAEAAEDMAAVVPLDAAARPLHSAQVLVGHALDGGGHDNVTVAVVPFPAARQGAGSA
ncbi:protein phosphatase 2C domain-containing protein [Streptomyces sp. NPDC005925]|uniref:PP2C family serine/threonine-protein phosphatase n=1 Tax=Streptomyces sp. NPDC005925 TaxID=3157172 RepID=UPI0033C72E18